MKPLTLALIGAGGYYLWKKNENPAWSPIAWLTASHVDKHVALEKVKVTSVPTPGPGVALDPNMSTDQVKQVNDALLTETDPKAISAQARALGDLGHASSAAALDAKAAAIGEAKAVGASETDIHKKQIEAAAPAAPLAPPVATGWGPYAAGFEGDYLTGIQSGPAIVGIQSGPAIVGWDGEWWRHHHHHHRPWWEQQEYATGIQSGPAIVGIQSGPAIVGWDGRGRHGGIGRHGGFEQRFGRHGRYLPHGERGRFGHEPWHPHHRRHHFRHPEEEVIEEEQPMPQPMPEEEIIEQPAQAQVDPGIVASWEGDVTGYASYGGGGLVAEYPGTPQQAQPYGYAGTQQQYGMQQFTQQGQPYTQAQQYQQPVEEEVVVEQPAYYPERRWDLGRRGWGGWGRGWGRRGWGGWRR